MDLHNGQVPSACVWAVAMDLNYGSRDVEWFITSEAATEDYKEVVAHIKGRQHGGTAERWIVILPGQRMEAEAVSIWVEALLLSEQVPNPAHARRLDVFRK